MTSIAALTLGDAIIVAVAGGIGTLIGGTITGIVTYRTKLIETRASANLELAGARRRQGERQAEVCQKLLEALTDAQATVWRIHGSRLDGSRVRFPETKALLEFRAKATSSTLLASRVVVPQLREQVRQTMEECEALLSQRTLQDVSELQARVEEAFEGLSSKVSENVVAFEAQAVQP